MPNSCKILWMGVNLTRLWVVDATLLSSMHANNHCDFSDCDRKNIVSCIVFSIAEIYNAQICHIAMKYYSILREKWRILIVQKIAAQMNRANVFTKLFNCWAFESLHEFVMTWQLIFINICNCVNYFSPCFPLWGKCIPIYNKQ